MSGVKDKEKITRTLFSPMMIKEGKLQKAAFPVDELLGKGNKDGCSVDRYDLLVNPDKLLYKKACKFANPPKDRNVYGFSLTSTKQIREIKDQNSSDQVFEVYPDPDDIKKQPPDPWDHAHALIRACQDTYSEQKLRGLRRYLIRLFEKNIHKFKNHRE